EHVLVPGQHPERREAGSVDAQHRLVAPDLGHPGVPVVHVGPALADVEEAPGVGVLADLARHCHLSFLWWSIQVRYSASTAPRRSWSISSSSCWAPMSSEQPI